MAWVRLDDGFVDHPKVAALSDAAFRAHVAGLCYCGRFLTDGFVPHPIASAIARAKGVLSQLLSAKLWEKAADGYRIHDYLLYNPSKSEHETLIAKRMASGIQGAAKRWATINSKPIARPVLDPDPSPSSQTLSPTPSPAAVPSVGSPSSNSTDSNSTVSGVNGSEPAKPPIPTYIVKRRAQRKTP